MVEKGDLRSRCTAAVDTYQIAESIDASGDFDVQTQTVGISFRISQNGQAMSIHFETNRKRSDCESKR
jgi:hypothetical protein